MMISEKEKRPVALTTSLLFILLLTTHGYVPRDYFNPELRHHQLSAILNILFDFSISSLHFVCKSKHFLLICKIFCFFFNISSKTKG